MDALPHRKLDGLQSCDGLYSFINMVFGENIFPDIRDYVVPLDLPKVKDRPAIKS
jgi:hypothetical protein